MIKINLLNVERKAAAVRKKGGFALGGQKVTLLCTLILVATALVVLWRYWSLTSQSKKLDQDIRTAQAERTRLQSVLQEVQRVDERKKQIQDRVALIEQLRQDQTGPVHMLDQISRALPPMVWLTELKQTAAANEVQIDGRCTSQTGVSDFVANLEASGYFKRGIDIVSSQQEIIPGATPTNPIELVKFSLKAMFQQPGASTPQATSGAGISR
jgi:type IV pilus assembly protein PilN